MCGLSVQRGKYAPFCVGGAVAQMVDLTSKVERESGGSNGGAGERLSARRFLEGVCLPPYPTVISQSFSREPLGRSRSLETVSGAK